MSGGNTGLTSFTKPYLKVLKPQRYPKTAAIAMFSAISGFGVGYIIGSRDMPSCNSVTLLAVTNSTAVWKMAEKLVAADLWFKALHAWRELRDLKPELSANLDAIKGQIDRGEVNSRTFADLSDISHHVAVQAEDEETWATKWLAPEMLFAYAMIVIVIGLMAAFAWHGLFDAERQRKTKPQAQPRSKRKSPTPPQAPHNPVTSDPGPG